MSEELVTETGPISNGRAVSVDGRRDAICRFLEDPVLDVLGVRAVRVKEIG